MKVKIHNGYEIKAKIIKLDLINFYNLFLIDAYNNES